MYLECDDLVQFTLGFLGSEFVSILCFVNKSFKRVTQGSISLCMEPCYECFCISVHMIEWAVKEGGCPLDFQKRRTVEFAVTASAYDVLKWCEENPIIVWDGAACKVAGKFTVCFYN